MPAPLCVAANISAMSRPAEGSAVILLYHRVGISTTGDNDLRVDLDDFRRQLHHLKQTYTVMPLDGIVSGLAERNLRPRTIAITFDDGYLENLCVVAPIVREFDIPVTFFVSTAGLTEPSESWWDVVERVMTSGNALPPRLDLFGDGTLTAATDTVAARRVAQRILNTYFFQLGAADRQRAVHALAQWSGTRLTPRESHRVLMTEELHMLARVPGVSIGAHSVHHLALTHLTPEECRYEIVQSKSMLEAVLCRTMGGFAYPYGDCDGGVAATVRSAGFRYAVTVRPGAATFDDDLWLLPRCEVKDAVARNFQAWLAARFDPS
jgi:peptidoglycan/xylan/chitin deacetylase (PgdA/CDA1 family)